MTAGEPSTERFPGGRDRVRDDTDIPSVRDDMRAVLLNLESSRHELDPKARIDPLRVTSATDRFRTPQTASETAAVRPPRQAASMPAAVDAAEAEARAYLAAAKHRVDTLVKTMLGSLEEEAWALRREAEDGIRERWRAVEGDAVEYLAEARLSADELVVERRRRIAELSDAITRGAERVTARLEDADRVRAQFDRLIHSLSAAADQIAAEIESSQPGQGGGASQLR